MVEHLLNSGALTGTSTANLVDVSRAQVGLSFSGWERFQELQLGATSYRRAFMAMKFGDSVLDSVVNSIFKPSAIRAGFELRKLTDEPKAGIIDNRMRVEIQSCDFVVADLTHDNLGAYWEAGYAKGLGKPVIYTCEKSKFNTSKTHFDTNHHHTVLWSQDSPIDAAEELVATIRATLPHLARLVDQ